MVIAPKVFEIASTIPAWICDRVWAACEMGTRIRERRVMRVLPHVATLIGFRMFQRLMPLIANFQFLA